MLILTSARQTLVSFLRSVLALFKAFLLLSTGTLIMGVLILELATIRISLSLWNRQTHTESETWWRAWAVEEAGKSSKLKVTNVDAVKAFQERQFVKVTAEQSSNDIYRPRPNVAHSTTSVLTYSCNCQIPLLHYHIPFRNTSPKSLPTIRPAF